MCISPDPSFARGVCLHQTMYKLNLYDGHFVDEEELRGSVAARRSETASSPVKVCV